MNYLDTIHKRKSATITTIIMILLLLIIFIFGLKYMDPPIESGIAVNFGTSNVGSGNVQPTKPVKSIVKPEVTEEQAEVKQSEEASAEEDSSSEEVLTQDNEESIKIKEQEKADKILKDAEIAAENAKIKADLKAKADAEKLQKERDDLKKKLDDQISGVANSEGTEEGSDGDDKDGGDKGKESGDISSEGYEGEGGNGGTGDYRLGNREPLGLPEPQYDCERTGRIKIEIEVNRKGEVVKAIPKIKGSNSTDLCLQKKAIEAALKSKWNADDEALERQIGYIIYVFDQGK